MHYVALEQLSHLHDWHQVTVADWAVGRVQVILILIQRIYPGDLVLEMTFYISVV